MIRVAAVGDIHLAPDIRGRIRLHLAGLGEHADVLMLAGDLTQHGTVPEAEVVAAEFADLGIPVVAVLGNHEGLLSLRVRMRQLWQARRHGGNLVDALSAIQIANRADRSPSQVVADLRKAGPAFSRTERVADLSRDQIEYTQEDPWVREMFEKELAKQNAKSGMPAQCYTDPNFKFEFKQEYAKPM